MQADSARAPNTRVAGLVPVPSQEDRIAAMERMLVECRADTDRALAGLGDAMEKHRRAEAAHARTTGHLRVREAEVLMLLEQNAALLLWCLSKDKRKTESQDPD